MRALVDKADGLGPVHNDHASCPVDDEWQQQPWCNITKFKYLDQYNG